MSDEMKGLGVILRRRIVNAIQEALNARPKGGMQVGMPKVSVTIQVSDAIGLMNLLGNNDIFAEAPPR
jgi:hypothetical protein